MSIYYDGANPNIKWNNIMWRGTLEDAGMRVGETYYFAEFGTAAVVNVNVRFLDADTVIIPNQPAAFERAITAPEGAVYVEMYVSLSGEEKPQRFTSYPMLVRGSARPAGFVTPRDAGGCLAELWPKYDAQTVNGVTIEPSGVGDYHVYGTAQGNCNIWVNANLEAGTAYLASVPSTSPDVYAQIYIVGQTVTINDGSPQRFEAIGGKYYLYIKVDNGKTVDATISPSLTRI